MDGRMLLCPALLNIRMEEDSTNWLAYSSQHVKDNSVGYKYSQPKLTYLRDGSTRKGAPSIGGSGRGVQPLQPPTAGVEAYMLDGSLRRVVNRVRSGYGHEGQDEHEGAPGRREGSCPRLRIDGQMTRRSALLK